MKLVIPVYNEEKTLGKVLERAKELDCQMIVVCNGCKDGSAEIAQEFMLKNKLLSRVIECDKALGGVGAFKLGIEYMKRDRMLDDVALCDADFEVDPLEYRKILRAVSESPEANILVGRRDPEIIPRESEKVISQLLGYRDIMCCIRYIKKAVLERFDYGLIYPIIMAELHGLGRALEVDVEINKEFLRESPTINNDKLYLACINELIDVMRDSDKISLNYANLFANLVGRMDL